MGILDEYKKLTENEESSTIIADKDVLAEFNKTKALMDEYEKNGTINGVIPVIKKSDLDIEFPDGLDPKIEKNASMDEYPDGIVINEGETPEELMKKTIEEKRKYEESMDKTDPIVNNFKNKYPKYTEADLTIIRSNDYVPMVVKAYCPKCGEEIISTAPVMFNPYTMDRICRYDCKCGWTANLDYAYPRLVMRNKNTGEEIEVYAK